MYQLENETKQMAKKRESFDSFVKFIEDAGFVLDQGKTLGNYTTFYEEDGEGVIVVAYFPGSNTPQLEFTLTRDYQSMEVLLVETYDERQEVIDGKYTALDLFEKECGMVASKFEPTVTLNFRDYQGDFDVNVKKGTRTSKKASNKSTQSKKGRKDDVTNGLRLLSNLKCLKFKQMG